jgi:hypothetical protein
VKRATRAAERERMGWDPRAVRNADRPRQNSTVNACTPLCRRRWCK